MTTRPVSQPGLQFAAIDLGSNSFHMVVAQQAENGLLTIVDRLKHSVRLAAGLGADGSLSEDAEERALQCLSLFGERIRDLPPSQVRAVGTNTLRKASDVVRFLESAQGALGHPVDIISGREEARLIYRGVVRDVEAPGRMLVLDIGGGSTELIIGEGAEPAQLDSLNMGCVSWSKQFFPEGVLTSQAFDDAKTAALRVMQGVVRSYRKAGWDAVVGSSGTVLAIETMLHAKGYGRIDSDGLAWLREAMVKAGHANQLSLDGLSESRRPVIAGGVAILSALVEGLRIRDLRASNNALREGVLLELVRRGQPEDIRESTVRHLMTRYEIDGRQAFRVQQTALSIFSQVAETWGLEAEQRSTLRWAAALHEAGMFVTYSGYHKHGAYLLTHADMPGFSRQLQCFIAALVYGHRGSPSRDKLAQIAPMLDRPLLHLACALRIATRIHRRRSPRPAPELLVEVSGRRIELSFPGGWLDERPLSRADLEEEAQHLVGLGYELVVR